MQQNVRKKLLQECNSRTKSLVSQTLVFFCCLCYDGEDTKVEEEKTEVTILVCKACGRSSHPDDANFCYYCGSSFREESDPIFEHKNQPNQSMNNQEENKSEGDQASQKQQNQPQSMFGQMFGSIGNMAAAKAEDAPLEPPIAFRSWILLLLLPFVPYIGPIAFLVMLFLWGFSVKSTKTQKNFARAMLIFVAILLIMAGYMMGDLLSDPAFMNSLYGV